MAFCRSPANFRRLASLLFSRSRRFGFLQCTLGNFKSCSSVVQAALSYATDTQNGFPSQIAPGVKPGAVPIIYRTARYSSVAIYPQNYPLLDEANTQARASLQSSFEQQLSLAVLVQRLIDSGLDKIQHELVARQKTIVEGNIANLLQSSKVCYNQPLDCFVSVKNLELVVVDEAVLVLPILPTASLRIMTTSRGVWTREESVKYMNSWVDTWVSIPPTHERRRGQRHPRLSDLSEHESASIVLFITGVALREAALYFENKLVTTVPLGNKGAYPDKFGEGWAMVVIETTRGNPGWRDIDLTTARETIWQKEYPVADGVFLIAVKDAYGRSTRFDIEYQNWTRVQTNDGVYTKFYMRNRWWDPQSNGVSVRGAGNWSNEGNGSNEERVVRGPRIDP